VVANRLQLLVRPPRARYAGEHTSRDVAQSGSAPGWGPGGRWFESSRPDLHLRAARITRVARRPFPTCALASRLVETHRSTVVRNLPNVLTTLRLVAVPVFIVLFVVQGGPALASGLLFLAASFTDFLDGWLARRFRVMSQYGKVIDPLADRLLVNSAVMLLCIYDARWFGGDGRLLGPEFLVVVARDAVAAYGFVRIRAVATVDVTRLGKWGMALMMAGLTWLLLLPQATWPLWPFWIGLAISVVVLAQYLHRYWWVVDGDAAGRATDRTSDNPTPTIDSGTDPRVG
jgi:CDP-diacylglycerol---glycerol-3-phosphate 3-phosphatidyltransferase